MRYGEGVFIGHRYYDARGLESPLPVRPRPVLHDHGFTDVSAVVTDDRIDVTLTATSTGGRDGRAVVQVYTGLDTSVVARPPAS